MTVLTLLRAGAAGTRSATVTGITGVVVVTRRRSFSTAVVTGTATAVATATRTDVVVVVPETLSIAMTFEFFPVGHDPRIHTRRNIELVEGNDTVLEITVKNKGSIFDLSGNHVEFYAKDNASDPDAESVMNYTTANSRVIVVAAEAGRVDIPLLGTDVRAGIYAYHLDVVKTGKRNTVGYGSLRVVDV